MSDNIPNEISTRQVELAISRLNYLSTLPCVACQYIPQITKKQYQISTLIQIIESEPSLASCFLSKLSKKGKIVTHTGFSLGREIERLTLNEIRDALLSMKVPPVEYDNQEKVVDRKSLIIHSISVACYAREIAQILREQIDIQLCYFAGLLHDIGKFALLETMPKSFDLITQQSKSENQSSLVIEKQQLGIDHARIGKRLAENWLLPENITLPIWLHHNINPLILKNMPETRIAAVVQLADWLTRQVRIGVSGSFNLAEKIEPLIEELEIETDKLQSIHETARIEIDKKIEILGLNMQEPLQKYCEAIQTASIQFALMDTELNEKNREIQGELNHLCFLREFLLSIKPSISIIDIAENFASSWQKFYQTGKVCLFLLPQQGSQAIDSVTIENLAQSTTMILKAPPGNTILPRKICGEFEIINADGYIDWLQEQLEIEFEISITKLLPLLFGNKVIGAMAFELHYPSDIELFKDKFRISACVAATILGKALEKRKESRFAERFVDLLQVPIEEEILETESFEVPEQPHENQDLTESNFLNALAELAAGAAHELNNPLAVISGRAQLLAEAEQNQQNKQILEQIQQNANEASEIIEDLMTFAEPPIPRPTKTDVSQLIDEAIQFASRKVNLEKLKIEIDESEEFHNLFIDSAQIVSAIAGIICNAIESYNGHIGEVKIAANLSETSDFVKISIEDNGCGMDENTLKNATHPFFSAKPAGRKRGMGLAYASRLIQVNKGSLSIASEQNHGTTVSIYLPVK